MSGQTQHSPVKTSNLPDKCPMSGANLQACDNIYFVSFTVAFIFKPVKMLKCIIL